MRPVLVTLAVLAAGSAATAAYFEADHFRTAIKTAESITGGSVERGHRKAIEYGCVACHDVPHVPGTRASVGPSLSGFAGRMYIAGVEENKPANLVSFLQDPRAKIPHGAMPNLHVTPGDAQDIAAFLYTLE
jgi:cytochrome c2